MRRLHRARDAGSARDDVCERRDRVRDERVRRWELERGGQIFPISLIKQLRSAQFTEPQAEGVVRATVDAMTRAHFISRDAFERELMSARADTHALKVEMNAH